LECRPSDRAIGGAALSSFPFRHPAKLKIQREADLFPSRSDAYKTPAERRGLLECLPECPDVACAEVRSSATPTFTPPSGHSGHQIRLFQNLAD
jgi:hypothetical protein